MSAVRKLQRASVEDYLAGELVSPIKHEYVGGVPYAMAGGRNFHNRIAGNAFGFLFARLRGKPCQPYNSDTKIRIRLASEVRFYYPDLSIVCQPNPDQDTFQDEPTILFEVLSPMTRRIDEGEKKDAYLTIPTLAAYVLIESEAPTIVIWRRTADGFVRETHEGLDVVLLFPEVGIELSLAEIYEAVSFLPET